MLFFSPSSLHSFAARSVKRYAISLFLVCLPIAPPVPQYHLSLDSFRKSDRRREVHWTGLNPIFADPARNSDPVHDTTLTIFAMGEWKGNLDADERGRGGLASLHTLVERARKKARFQGGNVILLYSGDLTGEKSADDFRGRILAPGMNLIRYMEFDGLSLSAEENGYLAELKDREIRSLPFLSFDARPALLKGEKGNAVGPEGGPALRPYRIVTGKGYSLFATGLTGGKEPLYESDPYKGLGQALQRQTGVDLFVLLSRTPSTTIAPVARTGLPLADANPAETAVPASPYDELQRSLFLYDPAMGDPLALDDPGSVALRTILIESGSAENRFFRLRSGAAVCRIQGRALCEITVILRNHRIIAIRQRFRSVNGPGEASGWIPPDRNLQRFLQR